MAPIRFTAKAFKSRSLVLGLLTLVKLPKSASEQLPSRGLTMVKGTINGHPFQSPLEPDGEGSHLLNIDEALQKTTGISAGDSVTLAIEPSKDWPEPKVPADLQKALAADPDAHSLWLDITPMARWDWIRWVVSTKQAETRKRRVEVACSKLRDGKRRPCCFNRTECTLLMQGPTPDLY